MGGLVLSAKDQRRYWAASVHFACRRGEVKELEDAMAKAALLLKGKKATQQFVRNSLSFPFNYS